MAQIDRLARPVSDLMTIIQTIKQKNVEVPILNLGMDTKTPTRKLMLTGFDKVAQFEREIMLELQREGVAKAKSAGKYKGRKPIAKHYQQEVIHLSAEDISKANIARHVSTGESIVFRFDSYQQFCIKIYL